MDAAHFFRLGKVRKTPHQADPNMEQDTIVGTSTCSNSCVSRTAVRTGTSSSKIFGTSTTCSGSGMIVSKKCRMFGNCPTICGTGASRVCTMGAKRAKSTMCSTMCRWTRFWARQEPWASPLRCLRQRTRRTPHQSSVRSLPGPVHPVCPQAVVPFTSRHLVEAVVGGCGQGHCDALSCLHHERRRRCLRCHAAVFTMRRHVDHWAQPNGNTKGKRAHLLSLVVVVVWDTVAQELPANSTHADLETWACAPQKATYPSPGMHRTEPIMTLIATSPFTISTCNISCIHVAEIA